MPCLAVSVVAVLGYNLCLVMHRADRTLKDVISHEDVAGKKLHVIRSIFKEIVTATEHLHLQGIIHGGTLFVRCCTFNVPLVYRHTVPFVASHPSVCPFVVCLVLLPYHI